MKKLLFSMVVLLFGLNACQKDDISDNGIGKEIDVRVSANLPTEMQMARSNDNPGAGDLVNRCIMEIYHKKGDAYEKYGERQIAALNTQKASFETRLVAGQTYKFVFWADNANGSSISDFADKHYNTANLANVSIADITTYTGNDDTRDAFFGSQEETIDAAKNISITLKRPFGQLNISTLDMDAVLSSKPTHINIQFKSVYTAMNLLTGELTGQQSALNYHEQVALAGTNGKLSVDYIFAPANTEEQYLTEFTMGFYDAAEDEVATAYNFTNIPIQRNYKTNVSGNLLTKKADISVTVDPVFTEPDINKEIVEVPTVAQANAALQNGAKHIVITEAPTQPATITLPKYITEEEVAITLPETNQQITLQYANEQDVSKKAPVKINITIPNADKIVILAPESTVTLNGQSYTTVEATTAYNTLIIGSDVTVENLSIKAGNVKIYGTVTNITKAENWQGEIIRCVASQADLDRAIAATGYDYILIEKPAVGLDGKGAEISKHVMIAADAELSNLIIKSSTNNGITLAADNINVILDGLTIHQTSNDLKAGKNCAILAANHNNIKLTVKNSNLIISKSNQRGINVHGATDPSSVCTIILDHTHIGPTLEVMGAGDYSAEQNQIFKGLSDTRGISIASHAGNIVIKLQNNSIIEGVFYAINSVQHHDNFEVNADNSRLDGRCAFNIWSDGKATLNVTNNSKLIGRNPFGGPTEVFATIVVNGKDGAWPGASNNTITVKNSEIYCYNNPETPTNIQYAADIRSPYKNTLNLLGNTKIYDKSSTKRLEYAVEVGYWINEINIDPTVTMEGNKNATILPSTVWDGTSIANPGIAANGIIYIGRPEELAAITIQELSKVNVVLVRDLDMNNKAWNAKKVSNATFDGQGHSISNLKASNVQCTGLFPDAISVTIKNLTIKNSTMTAEDDGKQNAYAGGFIGRCYGTNIVENCVLDHCIVQGINKVGGIIGFNAENTVTIKDCTIKGSTIKTDDTKTEHGQCGGIIGYVGNVYGGTSLISGNYIIDSKVEATPNTVEAESHRYNSIYVGAFQGTDGDKLTIDAPTNAIQNSTLNSETPETAKYMGLLGGIRYTTTLSTTTVLTINGKRYTE